MNRRASVPVDVDPDEKRRLEEIVGSQKAEVRLHRRARMVLLAASGESISAIARTLGTNRLRVGQWLRRFRESGLEGLSDAPRSGRPESLTALERHQIVAAACRMPSEFGLVRTLWSHESLAEAVTSTGLVRTVSSSTVGRILDEAEIKPHRVRMWCHSTDSAFQEKMQAIVKLYVTPLSC